MNLYAIRHAEPKIGSSDFYLSTSGENLPLVLFNLIQRSNMMHPEPWRSSR